MRDRTQARRQALDILFAADVAGHDLAAALADAEDLARDALSEDPRAFARDLVRGVIEHREEIDGTIRRLADRWELERMPAVDRNLLRIGIFELLHHPEIPVGATINDCVELAKMLSTPDSGRFVNGLLGRIAREARGAR